MKRFRIFKRNEAEEMSTSKEKNEIFVFQLLNVLCLLFYFMLCRIFFILFHIFYFTIRRLFSQSRDLVATIHKFSEAQGATRVNYNFNFFFSQFLQCFLRNEILEGKKYWIEKKIKIN